MACHFRSVPGVFRTRTAANVRRTPPGPRGEGSIGICDVPVRFADGAPYLSWRAAEDFRAARRRPRGGRAPSLSHALERGRRPVMSRIKGGSPRHRPRWQDGLEDGHGLAQTPVKYIPATARPPAEVQRL